MMQIESKRKASALYSRATPFINRVLSMAGYLAGWVTISVYGMTAGLPEIIAPC